MKGDRKFIKYKNNYIVNSTGEIWKITKNGLKKKSDYKSGAGYRTTKINGKQIKVHRIIMEAFKGASSLEVDHIDRDKTNNSLSNLEYVSREENLKRASRKIIYKEESYLPKELASKIGVGVSWLHKACKESKKVKGVEVKYEIQ